MPDDLTISGGGTIAVGTEQLFDAANRLQGTHNELAAVLGQLAPLHLADAVAQRAVDDATRFVGRAHLRSAVLSGALLRSADAYGVAERASQRVSDVVAGGVAHAVGFFLPLIALQALPSLFGVGAVVGGARLLMPRHERVALDKQLVSWLRSNRGVLSDPAFVKLVRETVMSVDDFAAGVAHVPPAVSGVLGALGITGVASSSRAIIDIGRKAGYLTESGVSTSMTTREAGGAVPTGWADRASRIPQTDRTESQVRIDRYSVPGGPDRFEVYVSGTRDFALGKDDQPFDMTSNLEGIAGGDPASVRAVEQAMQQAGITAENPVVLTGHSQGGLVAATIAASGTYDVQAIYTLGAPANQVDMPPGIPWVAVEHSDDIVPSLSGTPSHLAPIVVTRRAYGTPPVDSDYYFPAHQLGAYEGTAAEMDESIDPRLLQAGQVMEQFTSGAVPVESTTYLSVREG